MEAYRNVYNNLGLPQTVIDCALGEIQSPVIGLEAPAHWYGFPPALIPIWSDGSSPYYIGIWKHWFLNRELSFVQMYIENGRHTVQVARTSDQLFSIIAMMSISIADDIEPELEEFSQKIGLSNLSEVDEVSLATGDDPEGFLDIECFRDKAPLECVSDIQDYGGDFFNPNDLWRSCSFEIPDNIEHSKQLNCSDAPAWFDKTVDNPKLFEEFVVEGNLAYAWLTLNSSGWTYPQALKAMKRLDQLAGDSEFSQIAKAWSQVVGEDSGAY